ncbi:hypothetical protein AB4Z47_13300 [Nocardia sp. 2TAF39]
MADADRVDIQLGEPEHSALHGDAVDVEDSRHGGTASVSQHVAREQHPVPRQMQCVPEQQSAAG